jgi:hypothetical protein
MTLSKVHFVLLGIFIVLVGLAEDNAERIPSEVPKDATNKFTIHLQEGFYEHRQTIISVDGREVYRGAPGTDPRLAWAGMVSVTNASAHPVVVFWMPVTGAFWSNKIDLSKGSALGFSISTNGSGKVGQSTNFFYD